MKNWFHIWFETETIPISLKPTINFFENLSIKGDQTSIEIKYFQSLVQLSCGPDLIMKFLIILLTVLYINNSNSKCFPSISIPSIPQGFNISNVHAFKGYNATHFDGRELNPFQFDINDVLERYKVCHFGF